MRKVFIIGICGAGKSTLARQLSQKIEFPVIHLDQYYWKSGWVTQEKKDFENKVKELSKQESWIMDGNYSSTFNIRFAQADTLIVLDYSRYMAIFRSTKRIISYYGKSRPDMSSNCPERFDLDFYKYMWKFNKQHKPRTDQAIKDYGSNLNIYRFKQPKEAQAFLDSLN